MFSIVLAEGATREAMVAFVDALELFEIGYSWGGVTSLAVPLAPTAPPTTTAPSATTSASMTWTT